MRHCLVIGQHHIEKLVEKKPLYITRKIAPLLSKYSKLLTAKDIKPHLHGNSFTNLKKDEPNKLTKILITSASETSPVKFPIIKASPPALANAENLEIYECLSK